MATTVISTNQTSAGILYTITAADDTYILLPGVSAVANSVVFYSASAAHTSLLLAGTVVSSSYVAILTSGSDANVTIAETGLVVGNINVPGFYAVGLQGTNNRLTNYGQILTTNDIAVYMQNTGALVTNTGLISGGQMGVLFGSANSTIVNSGTISATYAGTAVGVSFDQLAGGTLDNSGQITAAGTVDSFGVRIESDNTVIRNTGQISGTNDTGILMTSTATNLTLYNSGVISGTFASLDFAAGLTSTVTNRGSLIGDVTLTLGDDLFDTVGGTVTGRVFGGAGNDMFSVSDPQAQIFEAIGEGSFDHILSTVSFSLLNVGEVENLTLLGTAADGTGNALDNIITGNIAANRLFGEGGIDQIYGGDGADLLDGGLDDDILFGGIGDDRLVGRTGADTLNGDDGEDMLVGGGGNDNLVGGEGDDTMIGGAGRESLTGGTEADQFVFRAITDSGTTTQTRDIIADFQAGLDVLVLSAIDADAAVAGNQAFIFLGTGAFTGAAGQVRYFLSGATLIIEGTVNADLVADFSIRLNGETALALGDLVL